MSDPGSPIWPEGLAVRGELLPLGRTTSGELVPAWPGAIRGAVNSAYNALMAPGVALTGQEARGAVPEGSFNPLAGAVDIASLMMGLGYGGGNLLGRDAGGTVFGSFRGYHGTPHTFEPVEHNPFGEFRDTAIGTGEGAQVYGYGHYVAGNKAVAEDYAENLARRFPTEVKFNKTPLNFDDYTEDMEELLKTDPKSAALKTLLFNEGKVDKSIADLEKGREFYAELGINDVSAGHNSAIDFLRKNRHNVEVNKPKGNLLHLEIAPEEHELLDWDLPLSQQHPIVQQRLQPLLDAAVAAQQAARQATIAGRMKTTLSGATAPLTAEEIADLSAPIDLSNKTGQQLYRMIGLRKPTGEIAVGPEAGGPASSAALSAAGIPGIKYLDAGSRNISPFDVQFKKPGFDSFLTFAKFNTREEAEKHIKSLPQTGEYRIKENPRSSNYVIFNPKDIRIIGRNGETLTMSPVDHDPFQSTK